MRKMVAPDPCGVRKEARFIVRISPPPLLGQVTPTARPPVAVTSPLNTFTQAGARQHLGTEGGNGGCQVRSLLVGRCPA